LYYAVHPLITFPLPDLYWPDRACGSLLNSLYFLTREALANFLNKLETEHFVSKTAIGQICEEMLFLADKIHTSVLHKLRNRLQSLDMPGHQQQTFTNIMEENPFRDLQQEFRSYFFLNKFIKSSPAFKYVEPKEICLSSEMKNTFQYISIVDTIATIVQDPGFKPEEPSQDGKLRGVKDGSVYAENSFFKECGEICVAQYRYLACKLNVIILTFM
jgi:hypothetical protein